MNPLLSLLSGPAPLTREEASVARELAQGNPDWRGFLQDASGHRVSALVQRRLEQDDPELLPSWVTGELRNMCRAIAHWNMQLTWNLLEILRCLEEKGIPAVSIQGPVPGVTLYPDMGLWESHSLEILVHSSQVRDAAARLALAGYRPLLRMSGVRAASIRRMAGHERFIHEGSSVRVDLLWEWAPVCFRIAALSEEVWRRSPWVGLGGSSIRALCPEDMLLFLCMRGTERAWDRLRRICDVAQWVYRYPEADWDRLFAQGARMGCRRLLCLGLSLARGLLNVPLEREVLRRLDSDESAKRAASSFQGRLKANARVEVNPARRLFTRMGLRERWADKLRDGLAQLRAWCIPTASEWLRAPLPDALFFLYYFMRPVCLMGDFFRAVISRRRLPARSGGFLPTPMRLVEQMLDLAEVGSNDLVYDLGCGDGRIVVAAAKRFGARGVGVDLDPLRILEAREHARQEGVEHRVRFVRGDALSTDLSRATVVALYLPEPFAREVGSVLEKRLRPGARVVSRDSRLWEWAPAGERICNGPSAKLYLWRINGAGVKPAEAGI